MRSFEAEKQDREGEHSVGRQERGGRGVTEFGGLRLHIHLLVNLVVIMTSLPSYLVKTAGPWSSVQHTDFLSLQSQGPENVPEQSDCQSHVTHPTTRWRRQKP